jgi:hypothetical protein
LNVFAVRGVLGWVEKKWPGEGVGVR